jgi:O-acetyl-ADP-ribose deacetylase (regulator of RNase III)
MKKIIYVIGDATNPQGDGKKYILHICNNVRGWGAGFVLSLSRKWAAPEKAYRAMSNEEMILGNVQYVPVENDITVVNMIGQHDIRSINGIPPVRYDAIKNCLQKVNEEAKKNNATIHCPRFGAGLSGGDWNVIESIIKEVVEVDVTVYDLK